MSGDNAGLTRMGGSMKESYYRISTHEKLFTKRRGKSSATDVGGQRDGALGSRDHKNLAARLTTYKPKSEKSR